MQTYYYWEMVNKQWGSLECSFSSKKRMIRYPEKLILMRQECGPD